MTALPRSSFQRKLESGILSCIYYCAVSAAAKTVKTSGLMFVALAVLLVSATVQNYLRTEGKLTLARHAWLRIAFIFASFDVSLWGLPVL
jgi:hypothetical protein